MLIDLTRLVDRRLQGRLPTGVDRVSLAYVEYFTQNASRRVHGLIRFAGRWIVLNAADSRRVCDALLTPECSGFNALIRRTVGFGYAVNWSGNSGASLLLNTGHSGLERPDYARRARRLRLRPLFFLHDLIPITHPEYCRPGEAVRHQRRLATMLSAGRGLVTNSQSTLAALEAYADAQGWRLPPCAVAPLAPAALPRPAAESPIGHAYFVVLGTIEPRKNHLLLLNIWRQLAATLGEAAPRLVVIGQRGWECEQVVDLLERCVALKGLVLELPWCSDAELSTWLRHARALLFPAFIEGYGLPLVEALAQGVPVIASDLPVFREVAGDIPDYVDPLDGPGWKRRILEYADTESAARRAQCARLADFRAPTWDAHFAVVRDLLRDIDAHR